jgi:hypothetical protein
MLLLVEPSSGDLMPWRTCKGLCRNAIRLGENVHFDNNAEITKVAKF